MLSFTISKINIGLNIVRKRPDGMHDIETFFYPIALGDVLEAVPASTTEFQLTGLDVPGTQDDNLVMKAYRALASDFELPPVHIALHKLVSMGAGLGGGSADAAEMLQMLNSLASLHLSDAELERYASRVGADCAFFIRKQPQIARGVGNEFEPCDIRLSNYHLLLVKPDEGVSTAQAYAGCCPAEWQPSLAERLNEPIEKWHELIHNDFEQTIFAQLPTLKKIKYALYDHGAIYASMSGSGSTIYGIFDDAATLAEARAAVAASLGSYPHTIFTPKLL